MNISTTTFIALLIFIFILFGAMRYYRLPKKYRYRKCMGKNWKNSFPNTPKEEIRKFLILFTAAFSLSRKNKLTFDPEDKILEIYLALNPPEYMVDMGEIEELAMELEEEYNINFDEVWHEDLSLGELFSKVKNA